MRLSYAILLKAVLAVPIAVQAQPIERNLPPAPPASPAEITAPPAPPPDQDDRPLGPKLSGVTLIGADEAVAGFARPGIDAHGARRLDTPAGKAALQRLLGQPLSLKLISEVEAIVVARYRALGHPFVSVSAPQQDISLGVLTLRVIEFRLGRVKAADDLAHDVRIRPGETIDAGRLSQDLDWLNRDPFRQVQAQFAPGEALGQTDLTLTETRARPWRIYAGYATSGSHATGADRIFLGVQAAGLIPWAPDALASYQFTGSPDAYGKAHPAYLSHAVSLDLPLAQRRALEVSFDHVETHAPVQDFEVRQVTDEGSIGLRAALSDFAPLPGDAVLGVEARRSSRETLFGAAVAAAAAVDTFQTFARYYSQFSRPWAQGEVDFAVHASPGGVGHHGDTAAYLAFSQGRLHGATYAYATGSADASWWLPSGFGLKTDLAGQYADDALPETEQAALGGPGAVRGYSLDDGAFDSSIVLRTELTSPQIAVRSPVPGSLQPYLLADGGWGGERRGPSRAAYSVGVGLGYHLARFSVSADGACALRDALVTRHGECRLEARLMASY